MSSKLIILMVLLGLSSCKWETSEEYHARRAESCRVVCHTHGGFAYIATHMTGTFINESNEFCVCQDGTAVPR